MISSKVSQPSGRSYRWRHRMGLLASQQPSKENEQTIQKRFEQFEMWKDDFPFPHEAATNGDDTEESKQSSADNNREESPSKLVHNSRESRLVKAGTVIDEKSASMDLDPLTAMLIEEDERTQRDKELDLQFRKAQALRRKKLSTGTGVLGRFMPDESEDYDENAAVLHIIDKDLNRLPMPNHIDGPIPDSTAQLPNTTPRHATLRSVLFVYHCCNPEPGYRQGMHEIASYLLFSLELDDIDQRFLGSEAYFMLQTILTAILPAYDVAVQSGQESSLNAMSRRVLELLAHAENSQTSALSKGGLLYNRLQEMSVPPAIYLTKWVRLLFSREVKDVLLLWDVFFDLVANETEPVSTGAPKYKWMQILEATAAARLLHHRQSLLQNEDSLHLLMNLPMEHDIDPILELMLPLLKGQTISLPPITNHFYAAAGVTHSSSSDRTSPRRHTYSFDSSVLGGNGNYKGDGATSMSPSAVTAAALAQSFTSGFSLNQVKQTIASKTQSISRRLHQEWENMAAEKQAALDESALQPSRSYDDDAWFASHVPIPSSPLRTTTYPPPGHTQPPLSHHHLSIPNHPSDPLHPDVPNPTVSAVFSRLLPTFPASSSRSSPTRSPSTFQPNSQTPVRRFPDSSLSETMERRLSVLQEFCMNLERQHANDVVSATTYTRSFPYGTVVGGGGSTTSRTRIVSEEVWTALADLEVVRQHVLEMEQQQTKQSVPDKEMAQLSITQQPPPPPHGNNESQFSTIQITI